MNTHCRKKYHKAEYKAAHIWHSRHDFFILVTLNVHKADCSGQGQCEQHWQLGLWMVTYLYMGFGQGQAEQQDKLDAQSYFCRLRLFSVIFVFVRMPQLILHHVLNNSFPVRI